MRQQRRGESAWESIGGIVVLAIIGGAIWFFNKDKSGTTEAERVAARAEYEFEQRERKIQEAPDRGGTIGFWDSQLTEPAAAELDR
jgi:hypothetical protein